MSAMLLAYLFAPPTRHSAVHATLVREAKAAGIPLRPFSFEALAELRARRAAGLPYTFLVDVPTNDAVREYMERGRAD